MAPSGNPIGQRTALYDRHKTGGGKLVDFAGWEMPVQYSGIRAEHLAVRTGVGMFDVSHMGQIQTTGPEASAFLQRLLSNDIAALTIGGAQYGLICRPDGGILDDLFTYRLAGDRFLTVTNAANHRRDYDWFASNARDFDVEVTDRAADFAMIAVQGPQARSVLATLATGPLPQRFAVAECNIAGASALVCGTGYTGEEGVELLTDPNDAVKIWDSLLAAGVQPAGLGARDTLRLEACFHLYGNDMDETRNPIEAGLGWCCKEETGFIGAEAVRTERERGSAEKLAPFVFQGPGIPRPGNPVVGGGIVTSGTLSPCLGIGIGMAYLPSARAKPGTIFDVDVRGKLRRAEVRPKPLYSRPDEK